MASGPSSDVFLSLRTSCDRCRFQKLKCSVLASSEAPNATVSCQRCARAMVPCVFSRRNRSRRTMPDLNADRKRMKTKPAPSLSSDDCGVAVSNAQSLHMSTSIFDDDWNQTATQNTLALHEFPGPESALGYTLQEDCAIDHIGLFTNSLGLGGQGNRGGFVLETYGIMSSSPDASEEKNNSGHSPAFETNVVFSECDNAIAMLLSLASDLHARLET